MNKLVPVNNLNNVRVSDYDAFGKNTSKALEKLSRPLRGKRVIHVNATAAGGGVAELLRSQIPFERALGIRSRWYVINAPQDFFKATKEMHNLLQGRKGKLGNAEKSLYESVSREIAADFTAILKSFKPDIAVLHDPQTLPLAGTASALGIPSISRLHIDLLTPNPATLEFARPYLMKADKIILSSEKYAACMPWEQKRRISVVYPAIDPLSAKNKEMQPDAARRILEEFSINPSQPIISQVSRFDPWKDPLGVIKAYYIAKNKFPDLQLILSGIFMAKDDPEAIEIFKTVKKHAKGDPDIFLFADPAVTREVSVDVLVSSIYTASTVVVQKSIREGFGLTMTEAMWKGKPLVAGVTTGGLIQVKNGKNGILVSSPEEAAKAVVKLLKNEKLRKKLGAAARESVRKKFLMPRFVADNLKIYRNLL